MALYRVYLVDVNFFEHDAGTLKVSKPANLKKDIASMLKADMVTVYRKLASFEELQEYYVYTKDRDWEKFTSTR